MPAPVLTLFHGYGEHLRDTVLRTDLVDEAMSRGWLVFAPLGAHEFNYGIDYAQDNIERAFEFIGARLPLDLDRIYGVGFSMGGRGPRPATPRATSTPRGSASRRS